MAHAACSDASATFPRPFPRLALVPAAVDSGVACCASGPGRGSSSSRLRTVRSSLTSAWLASEIRVVVSTVAPSSRARSVSSSAIVSTSSAGRGGRICTNRKTSRASSVHPWCPPHSGAMAVHEAWRRSVSPAERGMSPRSPGRPPAIGVVSPKRVNRRVTRKRPSPPAWSRPMVGVVWATLASIFRESCGQGPGRVGRLPSGGSVSCCRHGALALPATGPAVLDHVSRCLAGHFDIEHSTFQVELPEHRSHEGATHQ